MLANLHCHVPFTLLTCCLAYHPSPNSYSSVYVDERENHAKLLWALKRSRFFLNSVTWSHSNNPGWQTACYQVVISQCSSCPCAYTHNSLWRADRFIPRLTASWVSQYASVMNGTRRLTRCYNNPPTLMTPSQWFVFITMVTTSDQWLAVVSMTNGG